MFGVYFASDRSSSGKSTVTLAFSMMLKDKGYSLNVYKAGPDFIDPVILTEALDSDVRVKNLDPFLIPDKHLNEWFFAGNGNENGNVNGKTAFVAESAMGLYDGSSYIIPKKFKLPVVLVMDCRRISSTMASLVYGLKNYKRGVNVCGIILNNISSPRHYGIISDEIKAGIPDIKVFGYVLNNEAVFSIKERHLGLAVPPLESGNDKKTFHKTVSGIKDAVFKNVDFNLLVKTLKENSEDFIKLFKKNRAENKSGINKAENIKTKIKTKIKIAVALDKAFFFYYNFNFEILKSFGAEIVFFSPLRDKFLPKGTRAVYIGGGYPEIYAGALAENAPVRKEIYEFFKNNGIIYAECGGLMYMCEKITYKRKSFDAAGIFPFRASMDKGGLSLGYRTVRLKEKTFLGEAGLTANGHEFHYSKLIKDGSAGKDLKNILEYESLSAPGIFKPEGYNILNAVGSYMHLSFYSNKLIAENIVKSAKNF
ncbi:MAG: cobyrinate a,c-diamide synthase [Deltaproteobacteria bacterium]|nr:cobyrinate a,c-diamide synthase [Deltaproteobacteria bacterium]